MWIKTEDQVPSKEDIENVKGVFRAKFFTGIYCNALCRIDYKGKMCWYMISYSRANLNRFPQDHFEYWYKEPKPPEIQ